MGKLVGVTTDKSTLNKTDVLRSLATGLQQLSFEDSDGNIVFVAETSQSGDTVSMDLVDGKRIELCLKSIS